MIIDTPDGPKFEWEVDAETLAVGLAATEAAAAASGERAEARRRAKIAESESSVVLDVGLVTLVQMGDLPAVRERLVAGCTPNVIAFEFDLFPGSKRMFCNDWTPLTMASACGDVDVVQELLEARASTDFVCCSSTSSGMYRFWTALDCARTGDTVPFERDPLRHEQPRHPEVERALLAAGARASCELSEPTEVNTFGRAPEAGQRPNPCLDAGGTPTRPEHLYDPAEEEERRRVPGAPMLGRGGSGCPTTSMGLDPATMVGQAKAPKERVLTGGSRPYGC
mmetsp:Transcript_99499/g.252788  ORF Transcript_99499/g.252788 Transcript_99499/m.252788 type:complete len:281 (+) Transcript_99499:49-891(+)